MKNIILMMLIMCTSACDTHHYHDDDPYVYYESEVVEYGYTDTNYDWYDCWGTTTPFNWSNHQLLYCDDYACCTWEDYNCEVTYCYEPDVCGWHYAGDVCYY